MKVEFVSLKEARKALLQLDEKDISIESTWSEYQIFVHCAKTIEYSMTGYPKLKPAFIRNTIGKLVLRKFIRQGAMSHNLTADVPGSSKLTDEGDFSNGIDILMNSIDKFTVHQGELKPHLLFGKMNKETYDRYFAMHIADHLSVFQ